MTMNITDLTKEKIYAGILGKIIGVYAGRPFENWLWERIEGTFGEINRYVNIEAGEDLIVADDDITGTSMFVKSLLDHNFRPDFSAKHIGQSWLDMLIENKTVFWWGGYNMSTEHTAYLNLKKGIEAPASGSIAVNGKITAEQIGAQIFVDYWGLINPNNPDKTVAMARESASVGHDGEAVYGALIIAALVSMSFAEEDMDTLLDRAVTYIPADSDISRVIAFVRQCYAENSTDWRWAFTQLRENFGYDKFGGWCHMVPNHGLVILALLYGGKSFHKSMVIVNTLGWDTDCNAANVGCINAVRLGLDSLTAGYDWRTPLADRLYLPTAHSTDNVTDAVREANYLVSLANKIAYNQDVKRDKRFSFNYRGSVQGFQIEAVDSYDKRASLANESGDYLAVEFKHLVKDMPVKLKTLTNTCETDEVRRYPYHLLGSPTLFSGQQVSIDLSCDINAESLIIEPFIVMFDHDLVRAEQNLGRFTLINQVKQEITFTIPQVNYQQIAYLGFNILNLDEGDGKAGVVKLHHIDWSNTPSINMTFPASNVSQWLSHWWVNSFISTMTQELFQGDIYLVNDCEEKRVFVYGSDDFRDYRANVVVTPQSNKIWSVLFNYRGLKRHMEARFNPENESLSLIANGFDSEIVLATTDFKFEVRDWYDIQILSVDNKISLAVNGKELLSVESDIPAELGLDRGCIGVSTHFGSLRLRSIETEPAKAN